MNEPVSTALAMQALASADPAALLRRASRLPDLFGPSWAGAFRVAADRIDDVLARERRLRGELAQAQAEIARLRGEGFA